MRFKKLPQGMSLLELMLVFALAAFMIMVGFQMFRQGERQQDIQALQLNVDTLFQSLTNYYRSNCSIFSAPTPIPTDCVSPGTLLNSACSNFLVALSALELPPNWATNSAPNNIVDNTDGPGTGYIVQFNQATPNTVATFNVNCSYQDCNPANTTVPPPQPLVPATGPGEATPLPSGGSLVWLEQVAIKMINTNAAQEFAYMSILGADCLSSLNTGNNTVYPCSQGTGGDYLVWQRMPSFASPSLTSVEWPMIPMLKEFNLQYTHDQMMELSPAGYIDTGTGGSSQAYYLCGG